MQFSKLSLFTLFSIVHSCFGYGEPIQVKQHETVPGRLGYPNICVAEFGRTTMYFYMTPEKHNLVKNFINDINEKMLHMTTMAEIDFPVLEVTSIADTEPDPVGFDENNNPIYRDYEGTVLFEDHARNVQKLAEEALGIKLTALSQNMSLIMNFDANKFHQDQCPVQYEYLNNHSHPIPEYVIFQDLTLFDWEMAKGTISGTMVQDENSGDRFILSFFPSEIVCNVYAEPAIYLGPNIAPEYPGAATLCPHSPIPSIDYLGDSSAGSGKGKRVSVAVRGLVRKEQMDSLKSRCENLPINRPEQKISPEGLIRRQYCNGVILQQLEKPISLNIDLALRLPEIENLEIFEGKAKEYASSIQEIQKAFELPFPSRVIHVTKRDGGFSKLSLEKLGISPDSTIVIINHSTVPKEYCHYPLSENFTIKGLPWIQLYTFPPEMAMLMPGKNLDDFALTSVEEILFRDALHDIACTDPNILNERIVTQLTLFVFPK